MNAGFRVLGAKPLGEGVGCNEVQPRGRLSPPEYKNLRESAKSAGKSKLLRDVKERIRHKGKEKNVRSNKSNLQTRRCRSHP